MGKGKKDLDLLERRSSDLSPMFTIEFIHQECFKIMAESGKTITQSGWREWCSNENVSSSRRTWVHLVDAAKLMKRAYLHQNMSHVCNYAHIAHNETLKAILSRLEAIYTEDSVSIEDVKIACTEIANRAFVLGVDDRVPNVSTFRNWCRRVGASSKANTLVSRGQAAQILKMTMLYCRSGQKKAHHPSHRNLENNIREELLEIWKYQQITQMAE